MTDLSFREREKYLAENAMFARAEELSRELREVERTVSSLQEIVHRVVSESGHLPCEKAAFEVLDQIRIHMAAIDIARVDRDAREVATLKAQVDELEQEISAEYRSRKRVSAERTP